MKINRLIVHNKYDGHCAYCGDEISIKDMQVDHIRPKLRFCEGIAPDYHVDDNRNLNPACRACNSWKLIYFIEEFREQIQSQVVAARRYSRNFRMAERFKLVEEIGTPVVFYYEKLSHGGTDVSSHNKD